MKGILNNKKISSEYKPTNEDILAHIASHTKEILSNIEVKIEGEKRLNLINVSYDAIYPLVTLILFPDEDKKELQYTDDSSIVNGSTKHSKFFQIFYNEIQRLYISDYQIKPNNAKWELENKIYDSFFECLIDVILRAFDPNHKIIVKPIKEENQGKEISKIVINKEIYDFLCKFIECWTNYRANNFVTRSKLSKDDIDEIKPLIKELFDLLKKNKKAMSSYVKELQSYFPDKDGDFDYNYRAIGRFVLSVNYMHKFFCEQIGKYKNITAYIKDENKSLKKVTRFDKYLFETRECDLIFPSKSDFLLISKYQENYLDLKVDNAIVDGCLMKGSHLLFLDREELLKALFNDFRKDENELARINKIIDSQDLDKIFNALLNFDEIKKQKSVQKPKFRTKLNHVIMEASIKLSKSDVNYTSTDVFNHIKKNISTYEAIISTNPDFSITWKANNADNRTTTGKKSIDNTVSEFREYVLSLV